MGIEGIILRIIGESIDSVLFRGALWVGGNFGEDRSW